MFLQLAGADNLNFTIGNDWCGMNGAAKITGKTAHYEKMMKGVLIHLNFDFSKPGKCIVESNINSPEAQEQGIKELLGNVIPMRAEFFRGISAPHGGFDHSRKQRIGSRQKLGSHGNTHSPRF